MKFDYIDLTGESVGPLGWRQFIIQLGDLSAPDLRISIEIDIDPPQPLQELHVVLHWQPVANNEGTDARVMAVDRAIERAMTRVGALVVIRSWTINVSPTKFVGRIQRPREIRILLFLKKLDECIGEELQNPPPLPSPPPPPPPDTGNPYQSPRE